VLVKHITEYDAAASSDSAAAAAAGHSLLLPVSDAAGCVTGIDWL